jgi:diguanylate cyclase (GGDEF)-like protein
MNSDNLLDNADEGDVFEVYQKRSRVRLNALLSVILLPFITLNLINSAFIFSLLLALIFFQTFTNVVSYVYKKRYIFPTVATFSIGFLVIIYGIAHLGLYITYWAYPVLIIYHFYTPRLTVKYTTPFIITALALVTYIYHDQALALRFVATLSLMYFFTSIMIGVITEQQSKLKALATRDPLTNASNRNYMKKSFQSAIDRALRGYGKASLVYLDLDHFKPINDTYGHSAGDRILIELVKLVKSRIRQVDEIFRSGGEEFIILLSDTDLRGALTFADDLRRQIDEHVFHDEIKVTASLGVAEYHHNQDVEQWIKEADKQLYKAKHHGRNCVMPDNGYRPSTSILSNFHR